MDSLPNLIQELSFGGNFNHNVDLLPKSLTHLYFGTFFNQSVNSLSKNLTHLFFGSEFNQDVSELPTSLTHLHFGENFNQKIGILSSTKLLYLHFGIYSKNYKPGLYWYYYFIKLPNSLKKLEIESDFQLAIRLHNNFIQKLHVYVMLTKHCVM